MKTIFIFCELTTIYLQKVFCFYLYEKYCTITIMKGGQNMNDTINLELKSIGDIKNTEFFVPSYQRGYRWGKVEVERLLDDIYSINEQKNYCLQPVVVRKNSSEKPEYDYELIDGQQRLTTIYLIYCYMHRASNVDGPNFSLSYETREESGEFLKSLASDNLDSDKKEENIDFWFIYSAYETIQNWFEEKGEKSVITNVNNFFDNNVKVIWYEVGEEEDAISLFTRLNIGKIPLTSAELVKAMFLSKDSENNVDEKKQEEIALQWDNIERELHNDTLWYFLTNKDKVNYQTRIDLVLDLIAGKPSNSREKYYTFFEFDKKRKTESLDKIWEEIQYTFLTLRDWRENHELYHKIGYLIASESLTLKEIFDLSSKKLKSEFESDLDSKIKDSTSIGEGNYSEFSYENSDERKKMGKLLLLFNVESVRQSAEQTQWFPFDKFKVSDRKKVCWSLEHIHAQQSEGMNTQEAWKEWLKLHIPSVKAISPDSKELISEMEKAKDNTKLKREEFEEIKDKAVGVLSKEGSDEYLHSISNMALLNTRDNAVLNNSTFDVKRNKIIEMDKKGEYIPFCTRMVFLKYYTESEKNQVHFWGPDDREKYIEAINTVLEKYLSGNKIVFEKGDEKNVK